LNFHSIKHSAASTTRRSKPTTVATSSSPNAPTDPDAAAIWDSALGAARRIPPLWPLSKFVAVNPLLGLSEESFEAAQGIAADAWGADLMMPRAFFSDAIESGRITDQAIAAALVEAGARDRFSVEDVKRLAKQSARPVRRPHPTLADVAAEVTGLDWAGHASDRISFWAAGQFDIGQAKWRSPWRDRPAYEGWRAFAAHDRTPEIMGLKGFRAGAQALPAAPKDALALALRRLGLAPEQRLAYLHRLLAGVGGWAGHARYLGWTDELDGAAPGRVAEIAAIRAAWDLLIFDSLRSVALETAWDKAKARLTETPSGDEAGVDPVLLLAYEIAFRGEVLSGVAARAEHVVDLPRSHVGARPEVQAAFCIDVRSERMRRALEGVHPSADTIGFAGFFGVSIELAPLGHDAGEAQCPVLLKPNFLIREVVGNDDPHATQTEVARRGLATKLRAAWTGFKSAAVSSFAFVESVGLGFAGALARDSLSRAPAAPERLGVSIDEAALGARASGLDFAARLATAEGVLAGMSLTGGFAKIVALIGHGSTTKNNPYASALDCGACGGHAGDANARVAAAVLNDMDVRAALKEKGLEIPDDTLFVAGLHDTTTDEVSLLDTARAPASHRDALARLEQALADAARIVRLERAPSLGLDGSNGLDGLVKSRAGDWSQVRPEWGLAGCAAFIAAPRVRTRDLNLGGRAFLHSYEWRKDETSAVLELIMTAPLVVASWIGMQYYASTVDNEAFGSGDKTLHNVVGGLGVFEGNGGDLRGGLPWQSVHDGESFVHEPMRLTAIVEAPIDMINGVLSKHPHVRALFDNGWLHLIAILEDGRRLQRYDGDFTWVDVDASGATIAEASGRAA